MMRWMFRKGYRGCSHKHGLGTGEMDQMDFLASGDTGHTMSCPDVHEGGQSHTLNKVKII